MVSKFYAPYISALVVLLLLILGTSSVHAQCTPVYSFDCALDDDIHTFTLTGANSTSFNQPNTGCTAGGYANYTALSPVQMYPGSTYSGTISSEYSGEEVRMWIDFNNDLVYQASEQVATVSNVGTALSNFSIPIPPGAALGIHKMRVRLVYATAASTIDPCSSYSFGETHEYTVSILSLTPCSGTPNAGVASAPSPICPGVPFTVSTTGTTTAGNITYQWQDSVNGSSAFTNIPGATSLSYSSATGITVPTFYKLIVTCTTSNITVYSNIVGITISGFLTCYCNNSMATYTNDDDIGQIVVGSFSNPATPPTPQDYNAASTNTYTNFTALGPILLNQGVAYPISATQFNSGYFYGCRIKAWIDYNHNGLFDANELVLDGGSTSGSPATPTFTGTFTVPNTALPGLTRMRFVLVETSSAASVLPCGTYSWGETEDYYVNIVGPPTVTTNSPVCTGGILTITGTSLLTNPTYNLTGPGISPMSNTTGIFTVPNASAANSGNYNMTVTSGGTTTGARTFAVVVSPPNIITISAITPPTLCGGTNGSFTINGLSNSTAYTLDYIKNGIPQTQQTVTSSATGTFVLSNLSTATYSGIVLRKLSGGCYTTTAGPLLVPSPSTPPSPVASYNNPLCPGTTLTLSVNNPLPSGVYNWVGPAASPFNATGAVVTRSNIQLADSGFYSVTLTTPDNCVSLPTDLKVIVRTPPTAPIPGSISYCQFETPVALTAVGTNLLWYQFGLGGTGSANAPTPVTTVAGTQIFYVSQTNGFGCEGPRAAVMVVIKPKPAPPVSTVNGPYNYCQYEVNTSPLIAVGSSLQWYATPTGGAPLPSAPVQNTTVPGTYNYYVTQSLLGCESERAQITVIVKPKPGIPVVQSPFGLCQYAPPTTFPVQGQDLLWYENPTGGTGTPIQPIANTGFVDSFIYYVSQTVNGCESDRALLKVTVNYRPNGIVTASKPFVCEEDTITFTYYGNALPQATYNWVTPNPGTTILSGLNSQGPLVVRYNIAGNQYVQLQVNNRGCVGDVIRFPITVRPQPKVTYASKSDACIGEVVNLTLQTITNAIQYYNFDFDGGELMYGTANSGPYGVRFATAGTKVIRLTATQDGCSNLRAFTDTIEVHEFPVANIEGIVNGTTICSNDSVLFKATPGQDVVGANVIPYQYAWSPIQFFGNNVQRSTGVEVFGNLKFTTPIILTVTSFYGCVSTDSAFIKVQPCCDVIMPDAFSPNGDGRNDVFRPISKMDQNVVTFRIVNRWGQTVFETKDAFQQGWDGTNRGEAAPMETYFYFLRYQCADGKFYEKQGEVLLVR